MATITITINTDNAAFHRDDGLFQYPVDQEVGRILTIMATEFAVDGEAQEPRDISGNVVGSVEVTE